MLDYEPFDLEDLWRTMIQSDVVEEATRSAVFAPGKYLGTDLRFHPRLWGEKTSMPGRRVFSIQTTLVKDGEVVGTLYIKASPDPYRKAESHALDGLTKRWCQLVKATGHNNALDVVRAAEKSEFLIVVGAYAWDGDTFRRARTVKEIEALERQGLEVKNYAIAIRAVRGDQSPPRA